MPEPTQTPPSKQSAACWACGARQRPIQEPADQVDPVDAAVATWQWLFAPTAPATGGAA